MSLPVVRLTGTPYQQGTQHGRALQDQISHNLRVYFDRFELEGGVRRSEVLVVAERYLAAMRRQNPDYVASLKGVAAGSGGELAELAALNIRYEILYYAFSTTPVLDGCTAFAFHPDTTATDHLFIGQNWDWIPEVQGALLHTVDEDGLQTLSFTEAGIVGGKIGLNSHGLGLAINGLNTTDDDWTGLDKPFHVRCYEILHSRTLEAAIDVVTGSDRACSANFLIAQTPDQLVDLETAPDRCRVLTPVDGRLVHTNHFVEPGIQGVTEPPKKRNHTYDRYGRMQELVGRSAPVTVDDLASYLRDHAGHPYSICRHPDPVEPPHERYKTVVSVVMNLHARQLWATDGPPCQSEYQLHQLSD
jgi:isopenicillin-N N-acyltransferase-like protein